MALINYDKKFIYCHPYKCGGSSIRKALCEGSTEIGASHIPLSEVEILLKNSDQSSIANFTVISSIRNPFDQIVSLYEFVKVWEQHPWRKNILKMKFSEFVIFYLKKLNKSRNPGGPIICLSDFILDANNNYLTDYLIRYESFEKDLRLILHLLKLPTRIPYENKGIKRNHYRSYYSVKDIERIHSSPISRDLENFDYSF